MVKEGATATELNFGVCRSYLTKIKIFGWMEDMHPGSQGKSDTFKRLELNGLLVFYRLIAAVTRVWLNHQIQST